MRDKANADLEEAKGNGWPPRACGRPSVSVRSSGVAGRHAEDQAEVNKYQQRLVKVTPQHNEDVKKLLTLMGVPVVQVKQRRVRA
jgi:hypothetical protein